MNRLHAHRIWLTLCLGGAVAVLAPGCDSSPKSATSIDKSPDTTAHSATTAAVTGSSVAAGATSSAPDTPTAATTASSTASISAAAASGQPTAGAKPDATATASAKPDAKEDNVGGKQVAGSYAAWLQGKKEYVVGQQGVVTAVVVAQGGYKCNDKYPFKFKTGGGSGVTYPVATVRDKSYSKERTTMAVPFVPTQAGQVTVAGTYYFSVCTEEKCKFGKQDMSLTVNAVAK